jgi:hypothetical protein
VPRLFNDPSMNGLSPCWDLYAIIYDLYLLYYNLAYGTSQYSENYQEFKSNTIALLEMYKNQIISELNNPVVCANSAKIGINYLKSTDFYTDMYNKLYIQYEQDYEKGLVSNPTFEGFKSFTIQRLNNLNSQQKAQIYQCKNNMVNLIYETVYLSSTTEYAANGQELLTLIPKINQVYSDLMQCFNTYYTNNNLPDEYFNIIYENYTNTNPNNPNSDPYAIPVKKPVITNNTVLIKNKN